MRRHKAAVATDMCMKQALRLAMAALALCAEWPCAAQNEILHMLLYLGGGEFLSPMPNTMRGYVTSVTEYAYAPSSTTVTVSGYDSDGHHVSHCSSTNYSLPGQNLCKSTVSTARYADEQIREITRISGQNELRTCIDYDSHGAITGIREYRVYDNVAEPVSETEAVYRGGRIREIVFRDLANGTPDETIAVRHEAETAQIELEGERYTFAFGGLQSIERGGDTLYFDIDGNPTHSTSGDRYTYNSHGDVETVTTSGTTIIYTYVYDSEGNWIRKYQIDESMQKKLAAERYIEYPD